MKLRSPLSLMMVIFLFPAVASAHPDHPAAAFSEGASIPFLKPLLHAYDHWNEMATWDYAGGFLLAIAVLYGLGMILRKAAEQVAWGER